TKFLSDAWMYSRGFIDFPKGMEFRSGWVSRRTTDMLMEIPKAVGISANFTIKAAVEEMRLTGRNRVVVVDENSNGAVGVFDGSALKPLLDGSATVTDTVTKVMNKGVRMLTDEVQLEEVGRKLFNETYIVIQSAK
ncbi:unnamed protein product, partial [Dicrocoelium dendriticum]